MRKLFNIINFDGSWDFSVLNKVLKIFKDVLLFKEGDAPMNEFLLKGAFVYCICCFLLVLFLIYLSLLKEVTRSKKFISYIKETNFVKNHLWVQKLLSGLIIFREVSLNLLFIWLIGLILFALRIILYILYFLIGHP